MKAKDTTCCTELIRFQFHLSHLATRHEVRVQSPRSIIMPSCDASWNACTGWQEKRISAPASKIEITATPKHSFANSPPPFVPTLQEPSNNATNRPQSQTKGDNEMLSLERYGDQQLRRRSCPEFVADRAMF